MIVIKTRPNWHSGCITSVDILTELIYVIVFVIVVAADEWLAWLGADALDFQSRQRSQRVVLVERRHRRVGEVAGDAVNALLRVACCIWRLK